MGLSITDFKGHFIAGARPNLYRVTCTALGQDFAFLCKATQLPSSTVDAIDVPYLGRQIKVPGNRTFEDWEVTIINDTNFGIRTLVEKWLNNINGHVSNLGYTRVSEVYSDATVDQLDRDGATLYRYEIKDMFPTMLSAIELGFESNNEIEEYSVTFSYNYWSVAGVTD